MTCNDLIQMAIQNHLNFAGANTNACKLASRYVLERCHDCSKCTRNSFGCSESAVDTITTSLPYDCDVGYPTLKKVWSSGKTEWCCQHKNRGCTTTTTTTTTTSKVAHDCEAQPRQWTASKRAWCCQHMDRGCLISGTVAYKCDRGF